MFTTSRIALAACAWAATALPAMAADLPPIPYEPVPVPPAIVGGWYLRGDIGYANQHVDELDNVLYDDLDTLDEVSREFDGAPIIDVGIGYRVNDWFRVDVTGGYRSKSDFHGSDIGTVGADIFVNNYEAQKSEWLLLANAYADLGNFNGVVPFVGAGVGGIRTTISGFTDTGTNSFDGLSSVAFGDENSEWDLAWALYAGAGFEVTPALTLELGYRYLHIGDAESGDLYTFEGTNNVDNPMEFKDIDSHDVRLGMRYQFQ